MTGRVLVVDDNPGYCMLVRLALAGSGFDVVGEAPTFAEARSIASETQPDLVLVDLHLPSDDGDSGLAALQASVPRAVVLGVSSLADLDAVSAGGKGLVLLPRGLPPDELVPALERAIEKRAPLDLETIARVSLPPEPTSAREARRVARDALEARGCEDDVVDVVLLLLSEVVSNAILHARTELEVRVATRPGRVRIEVVDGDAGPIHRRTSTADAQSGRGTELIEALAEAWGTDRLTTGKLVWFEVASAEVARG